MDRHNPVTHVIAGGNQAKLDACAEFKISERSLKEGGEAGRAIGTFRTRIWHNIDAILAYIATVYS